VNLSRSEAVGTIRGLHLQAHPHSEAKLVRCLRGRVWDVAVDLRPGSATWGGWHAAELSPDRGNASW
jgi:dTDP-4-dehydrorhamnose 3,5-epimerase